MADGDRDARVVLTADVGQYQQQMAAAAQSTAKYATTLQNAKKENESFVRTVSRGFNDISKSLVSFQTGMVSITATLQKQMSTIEGVFGSRTPEGAMGGAKKEINQIRDAIKGLSSDLPTARGELAMLATSITKMGVTSGATISGLTRNFAYLGAATGEDSSGLASGMVGLSRQMGNLSSNPRANTLNTNNRAVQMNTRMNDSLTYLSSTAGAPAQSILDFSQAIAPTAKAAGMSQQQTMGTATAFIAGGAEGGYASSAFTSILNEVMGMRSVNASELLKYANALGISKSKLKEMSPFEIAKSLITSVGSSGEQGVATMNRLGFDGVRMQKALQAVNASGGLDKFINDAMSPNAEGSTERGAKEATSGLFDQLDKIKNQFTNIGDTIGSTLLPIFTVLAKTISYAIQPLEALATVVSPLITVVSAVTKALSGLGTVMSLGSAAALIGTVAHAGPGFVRNLGSNIRNRFASSSFGQGLAAGRSGDTSPARSRIEGWGRSLGQRVANMPGTGMLGTGVPRPSIRGALGYLVHGAQSIADRYTNWNARFLQSGGMWNPNNRQNIGPDGRHYDHNDRSIPPEQRRGSPGFFRSFGYGFSFARGARDQGGPDQPLARHAPVNPWVRQPGDTRSNTTRLLDAFNRSVARSNAEMQAAGSMSARLGVAFRSLAGNVALTARAMMHSGMAGLGSAAGLGAGLVTRGVGKAGSLLGSGALKLMDFMGGGIGLGLAALTVGGGMFKSARENAEKTASLTDPRKKANLDADSFNMQSKYNNAVGEATVSLGMFKQGLKDAIPVLDLKDTSSTLLNPALAAYGAAKKDYIDPAAASIKTKEGALERLSGMGKMSPSTAAAFFSDLYKNPNLKRTDVEELSREYVKQTNNGQTGMPTGYKSNDSYNRATGFDKNGLSALKDRAGGWQTTALDTLGFVSGVDSFLPTSLISGPINAGKGQYNSFTTGLVNSSASRIASDSQFQEMMAARTAQTSNAASEKADTTDMSSGGKGRGGRSIQSDEFRTIEGVNAAARELATYQVEWQKAMEEGNNASAAAIKAQMDVYIGGLKTQGIEFKDDITKTLGNKPLQGENVYEQARAYTYRQGLEGTGQQGTAEEFGVTSSSEWEQYTSGMTKATMSNNVKAKLDQLKVRKEVYDLIIGDQTLNDFLSGKDTSRSTAVSATYKLAQLGQERKETIPGAGVNRAYGGPAYSNVDLLSAAYKEGVDTQQGQAYKQAYEIRYAEKESFKPVMTKAAGDSLTNERLTDAISAAKRDPSGLEALSKARDDERAMLIQRAAETMEFGKSREREEEDYKISRINSDREFNIQRQQSQQDYEQQVMWSEQDFFTSRVRAEEDYHTSVERSTADFQLSQLRTQQDFQLSQERSKADFLVSMKRSQEDYNKSERRMMEDQAASIFDVYKRIQGEQTSSVETVLANMKEQQDTMVNQRSNLEMLKKMGLTQQAIDILHLTDANNAQQLDRFAQDIQQDPTKIAALNAAASGQASAATGLVNNDDNTPLRRQREDFATQQKRANEDFAKSLARSNADFRKSVNRSNADFNKSMGRGAADFFKNMNRSSIDFNKSMGRQEISFNKTMKRSLDSYNRQLKIADDNRARSLKRQTDDFLDNAKLSSASYEDLYKKVSGINTKYLGKNATALNTTMRNWITNLNTAKAQIQWIETHAPKTANVGVGGGGTVSGNASAGGGRVQAPSTPGSGGGGSWATGGLITGPGTKTSDSIPVAVSNGEYVIKASSVDKYGVQFMDAINKGEVAKRFSGGRVSNNWNMVKPDNWFREHMDLPRIVREVLYKRDREILLKNQDRETALRRRDQLTKLRRLQDQKTLLRRIAAQEKRKYANIYNAILRDSVKRISTANKGITGAYAKQVINNYNNTNFNGDITVRANDPMEMARQLQQQKRLQTMRGLVPNR